MGRRAHPPKWFFFIFTLHYICANYSTTRNPSTVATRCNEDTNPVPPSFPALLKALFGLSTPLSVDAPPPKSTTRARFRGLWATTTASTYQPPPPTSHNPRNRALAFRLWGPGINLPPQPPKSSICARFRPLWAFSGCHHDSSTTPTTAEIEHPCSFLAVVGFLWPLLRRPSTTPHNRRNRVFMLVLAVAGCYHRDNPSTPHRGLWASLPTATTTHNRPCYLWDLVYSI